MQSRHTAQTAFLTQKVERLADQNAELRKAKAGDPSAQEVVRRKVDGIKSGYEIRLEHMTTKVEGLADTNAALRKELRECEAKRKMGDRKEEGEGGDVESVSKKVKN
jgi:phage shock protein A